MGNEFYWVLVAMIFVISAEAKSESNFSLVKAKIKNSSSYVVKEGWIACYKNKNGSPSDDVVEIFYRGDRLSPQKKGRTSPLYSQNNDKLYIEVNHADNPSFGCFVEANNGILSPLADTTEPAKGVPLKKPVPPPVSNPPDDPISNTSVFVAPPVEAMAIAPDMDEKSAKKVAPKTDGFFNKTSHTKCVYPDTRLTREIKTTHGDPPSELPCKILLTREDGSTQLIAKANNTIGYCEEKKADLLVKLGKWGWQCQ